MVKQISVSMENSLGRLYETTKLLGEAGINIGTFHLGRREQGGDAILLLSVDNKVPQDLLDEICKVPNVQRVWPLHF